MGLTKLPRALHHIPPTSCDRSYYSAENEVVKSMKGVKGYRDEKDGEKRDPYAGLLHFGKWGRILLKSEVCGLK